MTFEEKIYHLVALIPKGKVASYGQLAVYAGNGRCARRVGRAMAHAPECLPCHRVVNSAGHTVPAWPQQRTLLLAEGIPFTKAGHVAMRQCRWQGP